MRLSKKGIYALRVLRHLALEYGQDPLSVKVLAEREGLSVKYLEQVLVTLKNAGILSSIRGKEGGYRLANPPKRVTLGDVIRAVDGRLAPIPCASRTAPSFEEECPEPHDSCWLRMLMLRVRDRISAVLDGETIADMVESSRDMQSPSARRCR